MISKVKYLYVLSILAVAGFICYKSFNKNTESVNTAGDEIILWRIVCDISKDANDVNISVTHNGIISIKQRYLSSRGGARFVSGSIFKQEQGYKLLVFPIINKEGALKIIASVDVDLWDDLSKTNDSQLAEKALLNGEAIIVWKFK